ncbi:hypothetical protein mflW37_5690 [Mesoplasma florum W37]|uniref:Terminase n=1 Tax=Mesoplasma florum TaxID=2151 RepID=A0AAD0HSB3_MESFO|nr:hypothetical protein [Mesoplasma florum]AGY41636.1 hypothetical protein mflW37_5690 [Mesoplasma florum W37]AVN59844.1 hypothetical protein CG008_03030 [Mesoplasma florum]AVN65974.1 hypothetical protein MflW12_5690 [Mesoplasma florum]
MAKIITKWEDLKPSKNNFNFTFDVLDRVWNDLLKEPFSTKSLFHAMSGAKGFGKTFLICLLALFLVCNFEDYNAQLAKYTYASAKESYFKTMKKVMNFLHENYGVTVIEQIGQNKNALIKEFNSESKCGWVFENGREINVIGFDNTSKWEGVPAAIGEIGMFAIDEVIPLGEEIIDEAEYVYKLVNLMTQVVRGKNLTTCFEPLPQLKGIIPLPFNENETWQMYKKHYIIFGFNNHDTNHPIYQMFMDEIAPLTDEVKEELDLNAVSYREDPTFLNMGATVIRGTTAINKDNLNPKVMELAKGIKQRWPETYNTLFKGDENQMQIDKYAYRKDLLENAQFFSKDDFYYDETKRWWFDQIRIGSDYADGGDSGDDAVTILMGFELDAISGIVKGVYILDELSISTKKFKNMEDKVSCIANFINDKAVNYEFGTGRGKFEEHIRFKIGADSRTVKDFLIGILERKYDHKRETLEKNFTCFVSTGSKGWKIESRHYMWKRLLNEKKLFFANELKVTKEIQGVEVVIKKHGYLYDELHNCKLHPKKDIRDETPKKNKLDAINAAEHALSYFRYNLFE